MHAVDLPLSGGKLLFVCHESDSDSNTERIARATDRLFAWLGTPDAFTIILFWIHAPRILEINAWPTKESLNGGWTIVGSNEIVVYRSEEWDRVLIHETIHALGWDWQHMPSNALTCWNLSDGSSLMPHLFEAWTELYAEWLWCGWHSMPWETQIHWMYTQSLQILARRTGAWTENTNVFAYYVLKTALAQHIAFLWAFRNGTTHNELLYVLCDLVRPVLERMYAESKHVIPKKISLRMTACAKK